MAIIGDTNFGSYDHEAADRTVCTRSRSVVFHQGSATLPRNCPVAYNTSLNKWVPCDPDGSTNGVEDIRGFVWPEAITLNASNDVTGTIMVEGTINVADINTAAILAVLGEADFTTNLKGQLGSGSVPTLRELGIIVEGLDTWS